MGRVGELDKNFNFDVMQKIGFTKNAKTMQRSKTSLKQPFVRCVETDPWIDFAFVKNVRLFRFGVFYFEKRN